MGHFFNWRSLTFTTQFELTRRSAWILLLASACIAATMAAVFFTNAQLEWIFNTCIASLVLCLVIHVLRMRFDAFSECKATDGLQQLWMLSILREFLDHTDKKEVQDVTGKSKLLVVRCTAPNDEVYEVRFTHEQFDGVDRNSRNVYWNVIEHYWFYASSPDVAVAVQNRIINSDGAVIVDDVIRERWKNSDELMDVFDTIRTSLEQWQVSQIN